MHCKWQRINRSLKRTHRRPYPRGGFAADVGALLDFLTLNKGLGSKLSLRLQPLPAAHGPNDFLCPLQSIELKRCLACRTLHSSCIIPRLLPVPAHRFSDTWCTPTGILPFLYPKRSAKPYTHPSAYQRTYSPSPLFPSSFPPPSAPLDRE